MPTTQRQTPPTTLKVKNKLKLLRPMPKKNLCHYGRGSPLA